MDIRVDEILTTVAEYMVKLKAGIIEAAELFQNYEENKGAVLLCDIIEGIEWITDALVKTNKLNNERILEINNKLGEIVAALENQDYILVGDLMQYEFLPVIEEIEKNLL